MYRVSPMGALLFMNAQHHIRIMWIFYAEYVSGGAYLLNVNGHLAKELH